MRDIHDVTTKEEHEKQRDHEFKSFMRTGIKAGVTDRRTNQLQL